MSSSKTQDRAKGKGSKTSDFFHSAPYASELNTVLTVNSIPTSKALLLSSTDHTECRLSDSYGHSLDNYFMGVLSFLVTMKAYF